MEPGFVIGVFDGNEHCFGVAEINSPKENCVISAFADDPFTPEKDGFENDDQMFFKVFSPKSNEVLAVEAIFDSKMPNNAFYAANGISTITGFKNSTLGVNSSYISNIRLYPNPTNGIVNINGITNCIKMEILSCSGEIVKSIIPANDDQIKLNLTDLPAGIYHVKIVSENSIVVQKLIIQ